MLVKQDALYTRYTGVYMGTWVVFNEVLGMSMMVMVTVCYGLQVHDVK